MFDDLHHHGRIETFQALVAIHQRSMKQSYPFSLLGRHAFQFQPVRRDFERAMGNVHCRDLKNAFIFQQLPDQTSFSAAEVEHGF